RVWDVRTKVALPPSLKHGKPIRFAAFSPDAQRVITASEDGSMRTWDLTTATADPPEFREHRDFPHHVSFHREGKLVVSCVQDNTACIWEGAKGGAPVHQLFHNGWVQFAACSPDGGRVIRLSSSNTAR